MKLTIMKGIQGLLVCVVCYLAACSSSSSNNSDPIDSSDDTADSGAVNNIGGNGCDNYPDQSTSEYVLPWQTGLTFTVMTGNCAAAITHSGNRRYAYDFIMPFGTEITAARAGEVIRVVDHFADNDRTFTHENRVFIRHDDGSIGLYFHIMQNGSLVSVGDLVNQGQIIAILGTSGSIGSAQIPHLHFEVASEIAPIISIPVTFRNTRPHPNGLNVGEDYTALFF